MNNDPILWTMLNAIKQQQAEIEALTISVHEKNVQIGKLMQQAQALQGLQRRMAVLERLLPVEMRSGANSETTAVVAAHGLAT